MRNAEDLMNLETRRHFLKMKDLPQAFNMSQNKNTSKKF